MSLRLDWEIESEQQPVRQASGEDPESRRRRRRRRLIILLLPLLLLVMVGVVVGLIALRLRQIDAQVAHVLQDTVDAEVATLRIGDEQAYLNFQRSADNAWLTAQQDAFSNYQALKIDGDIQLTGQIVDTVVDGTRARVQVQEIIDGAPYVRTWFYWRYDDGWRHVPPDYTFWGDVQTLDGNGLTIRYQEVDAALATALRDAITGWVQTACGSINCGNLPTIRVDILPDPGLENGWAAEDIWQLKVRSPYVELARMDTPLDFSLRFELANIMAERLALVASNSLQPTYPADAFYLRASAVSWLVGKFASVNTNTFLMSSLAQNYGDQAVGTLLSAMQPDSSIALLNNVTGAASLAQANVDWRDFLTWRLALEDELIQRGDESNFLALYATNDEAVRTQAYARYNAGPTGESKVVVAVTPETAPDGTPQLRAQIEAGNPPEQRDEVLFRLVNENWLRAN
ncbi:MAG: hypothetical protein CL610_04185 [Anaerolineaceae bacterium]|nr:hypothetical protein [Anaerolineaceae bacterium]